jgi:hypothetical protein
MNGIIYLKSRYFTFNAAIYNPVPIAVTSANNKNNGRKSILISGIKRVKTIIKISITKEIRKSIRQTITVLAGTINLGK